MELQSAIKPTLRYLRAIRQAKADFINDITKDGIEFLQRRSGQEFQYEEHRDTFQIIRGDHCFQIMEFFFALHEREIQKSETLIREYIYRHNQLITKAINNPDILRNRGWQKTRLYDGLFNEEQITFISSFRSDHSIQLDQSSLSRFMILAMSSESCRKTVIAMSKIGVLERISMGQKIIRSNGIIENHFRSYIENTVRLIDMARVQ